jgi:hypothetical protein
MATSINPELLAQILGAPLDREQGGGYGATRNFTDPTTGKMYSAYQQYRMMGQGADAYQDPTQFDPVLSFDETSGDGLFNSYNPDGSYRGSGKYDNSYRDLFQALALMAPAVAGVVGAAGAAGGAGGAGASGSSIAGGSGLTAGGSAGYGSIGAGSGLGGTGAGLSVTPAMSAAFTTPQLAAMGAAGAGSVLSAGSAGGAGAGAGSGGGLTMSQIGSGLKTGVDALGGGGGVAALLGGVAGAMDGGDKTQSTNRDPWAPAQDFLKQQIGQGQQLSAQYQAQPFSGSQKAGYNNFAGLLDLVNNNAGGLLSGFQANASGANQFQRGNPRGLIGSSFSPTAEQWNPQTYGRFGG